MDREEDVTKTGLKLGGETLDKGAKNRSRANQQGITNGRRTKRRRRLTLSERVAIIGAAATVIVALLGFQPLINWLNSRIPPTSPATISILSATPFTTHTQAFLPTETSMPVVLPSLTFTPNITVPPTDTATIEPSSVPKLIVLLVANKTSGKAPLKVKFDARESYLTDYGGQTYVCRNGACYYTWKVYSGGRQMGKSVTDSGGTFDYAFGRQGTYMVTVWICRGKDRVDCGGSGAQIIVTK